MNKENSNENTAKKNKIPPIAIIRTAVQLVSFILVPALFINIFSALGKIWESLFSGTFRFDEQGANILLLAAVFVITAIWGRFFCGFICSFGTMQDLLWLGGRHLPFRPVLSQRVDRILKYVKYAVLLFIVIGVWTFDVMGDTVWSPWEVFGMYASPWKGFPTQAMFLSIGGLLLLLTIIGSLLIERFFCKYLCPLGALFTLASHFRVFKLKREAASCSGSCRVCSRKCAMSIPLYQYDKVRSGECINCMKCTAVCARGNIKAEPVAAVSGTLAAAAIAGVSFVGTLPIISTTSAVSTEADEAVTAAVEAATQEGRFKNGSYVGYGSGYRGTIEVTVLVSGGAITEIAVNQSSDDSEFFSEAEQKVIPAIIAAQNTNVATVSGATFSSQGIIDAVADALDTQLIALEASEAVQPTTVGYEVTAVSDGTRAIEACMKENYDAIVLDVMMPDTDGFTACKKIRASKDIPVLMLSARGTEYDKLSGFEVGVDDYVTKPFSPKELMARLKVIISRHQRTSPKQQDGILRVSGIELDTLGHTVRVDGVKTELTAKEYALLLMLARNRGIVLTRDRILNEIWGYDYFGDDRTVDWQIKLLRMKLGSRRDCIKTIRGVGYKLEEA